jgi:hypothetical protein
MLRRHVVIARTKEAANSGGEIALNWIGGIFIAALITITFAFYSDIHMTHFARGSFFAIVGLCSVRPN